MKYKIERAFLGQFSVEEFLVRIIEAHVKMELKKLEK